MYFLFRLGRAVSVSVVMSCATRFEKAFGGVSVVVQQVMNPTGIHEDIGSISDLTQWVKELACSELWCRSQMGLRTRIAVVGQQLQLQFDP